MTFFHQLDTIMRQDFGGRGLLASLPPSDLEPITRELLNARRTLILTGFPVLCPDGTVIGETDGPLGAADLAFALTGCGCQVTVATDPVSLELVKGALSVRCPEASVLELPFGLTTGDASEILNRLAPTHLITLERPGKAADGHYHNMRGESIDTMMADTDCFLALSRQKSIVTISIGDGGNEMGMGGFRKQIEAHVPFGQTICAALAADFTLAGGVSNWWGLGAAALLSLKTGRFLLPSPEQEKAALDAVVKAGGVDGCTKRQELTVDHLPLDVHLDILSQTAALVKKALLAETA